MLLSSGVSPADAIGELVDNRVPKELAEATVRGLVAERRSSWEATAKGLVWTGALLLLAGAGLTLWSFSLTDEGGSFVVMVGLIGSGMSSLIVAGVMLMRPRPH